MNFVWFYLLVNLPQSMGQNAGVQQSIQNMTAMNNHPMNMNTHNAMMSPSAVMVSLWIPLCERDCKFQC